MLLLGSLGVLNGLPLLRLQGFPVLSLLAFLLCFVILLGLEDALFQVLFLFLFFAFLVKGLLLGALGHGLQSEVSGQAVDRVLTGGLARRGLNHRCWGFLDRGLLRLGHLLRSGSVSALLVLSGASCLPVLILGFFFSALLLRFLLTTARLRSPCGSTLRSLKLLLPPSFLILASLFLKLGLLLASMGLQLSLAALLSKSLLFKRLLFPSALLEPAFLLLYETLLLKFLNRKALLIRGFLELVFVLLLFFLCLLLFFFALC